MQKPDCFSSYHPLVNFIYFAAVISFSVFFMHPLSLLVSLCGSAFYYVSLSGRKSKAFILKFTVPVMLLTAIMNPLLSHEGVTILFYLPTKNPLTLESIVYGVLAALMLSSVMLWFCCFSAVMTSDKFIYLFSRFSPSLSLLLSMTLRFIPRLKRQFETVSEIQNSLYSDNNKLRKIKNAVNAFISVVSWGLENAAQTADSMKSRGYGTKKRTSYNIYYFTQRDYIALIFILFCVVFIVCGSVSGELYFRAYPDIKGSLSLMTIIIEAVFAALCIMPFYLERREKRLWRQSLSEI